MYRISVAMAGLALLLLSLWFFQNGKQPETAPHESMANTTTEVIPQQQGALVAVPVKAMKRPPLLSESHRPSTLTKAQQVDAGLQALALIKEQGVALKQVDDARVYCSRYSGFETVSAYYEYYNQAPEPAGQGTHRELFSQCQAFNQLGYEDWMAVYKNQYFAFDNQEALYYVGIHYPGVFRERFHWLFKSAVADERAQATIFQSIFKSHAIEPEIRFFWYSVSQALNMDISDFDANVELVLQDQVHLDDGLQSRINDDVNLWLSGDETQKQGVVAKYVDW